MLKAGKTPEDLIKEINDATREIKKEDEAAARKKAEAEKKEKAIADARQKVVDAMKAYAKVLYGVEPDVKLMDDFNSDLAEIEKASKLITVDDDERLRRFLRGILW